MSTWSLGVHHAPYIPIQRRKAEMAQVAQVGGVRRHNHVSCILVSCRHIHISCNIHAKFHATRKTTPFRKRPQTQQLCMIVSMQWLQWWDRCEKDRQELCLYMVPVASMVTVALVALRAQWLQLLSGFDGWMVSVALTMHTLCKLHLSGISDWNTLCY